MRKVLHLSILLCLCFSLWVASPRSVYAQSSCDIQNGALIGTLSLGLNCLDGNGWSAYELQSSNIPVTSLNDVAVCPDTGAIMALHIFGISVFDGSGWSDLDVPTEIFAPNALACAPGGVVWIAHMGGLSQYDGANWTTFPKEDFGTSPFIIGVDDVAVGVDGSVWAATSNSVARYGDGAWEVFENGSGFDQDYSLGGLVLNSDGLPIVAHSNGVLTFDGSGWSSSEAPITVLDDVLIDGSDRLWVGSLTDGVAVLEEGNWTVYNRESGLSSNKIHALASDAQGRIWVGTEWGLNVLEGDQWTAFQMSNAGLLDNNIQQINVLGGGPALPALEEKAPGSIIGLLEDGRDPAANLRIELCTETLGGIFYGETPCEGQPGSQLTTSNEAGEFTFESVPPGRYEVTIETPTGWIYFIGVDTKVLVEAGQTADLEDIDISE
ncbi:MAG: hypothetical protein K8L97_05735 [Anaerolineae bacterium]|nr:hypothetical protein [Anaerolineae bacterium]